MKLKAFWVNTKKVISRIFQISTLWNNLFWNKMNGFKNWNLRIVTDVNLILISCALYKTKLKIPWVCSKRQKTSKNVKEKHIDIHI